MSWSLTCAPPRFATSPTPSLVSEGRPVAALGAALGTPFLPWQRYVADVAGERLPDGRYRYPIVIVTVPRQSGKTVLLRCMSVHRCLTNPHRTAWYTAQTGKDARARWEDMVVAVETSALGAYTTTRLAAGSTALKFPNGSALRVFAPKRDALHGETPPLVMLDEAWKHDPALGEALMGAIRPAQITLRDRQLWIVSTAGDEHSAWFRAWVDAGRAATLDPDASIAYFEWSFPPDAPHDDPATWAAYHPTYGQLVTEDDLRDQLSQTDFRRAYGNLWPDVTADAVIPRPTWDAMADPAHTVVPIGTPYALGLEVGPDGADASLLAAWRDSDGVKRLTVVEHAGGTSWLAGALDRLAAGDRPPAVIAADERGPARPVIDRLTRAGHDVVPIPTADYAAACAQLVGDTIAGDLRHDGAEVLADAVEVAVRKTYGDLWLWDRRRSGASITAVVAGTVASWYADHMPEVKQPAPFKIYAG